MARTSAIASWLPNEPHLQPFYSGVNVFAERYLTPRPSVRPSAKTILDPILGYVQLEPDEISLLDTHLFQRLRGIKQLGLAHYVYPGLGYSRFEHTVGVVGRIAQFLSRIRSRPEVSPLATQALNKHEKSLRLAGLFHDVGHCLFSHASERVISRLTDSEEYPGAAAIEHSFKVHLSKKLGFAEIFSLSILGSPSLKNFLLNHNSKSEVPQLIENAARFVAGLPVVNDPHSIFMAQIMSSGLDADKLDYMLREAHFSGIKLEIDLDRLFDKLAIFQLAEPALPEGLQYLGKQFKSGSTFSVLGLTSGGKFSFEEFCISRLALYEKIYLHQKVRAAEGQLERELEKLIEIHPSLRMAHVWLYLPEQIIEMPEITLSLLDRQLGLFGNNDLNFDAFRKTHLTEISQRRLLNRAYAFGPRNALSDPPPDENAPSNSEEPPSRTVLEKVKEGRQTIHEKIWEETKKIANFLQEQVDSRRIEQTIIDIPRYESVQQGHGTLYFDKSPTLGPSWTIPVHRLVESYKNNRAIAYVFASPEICPIVSLAAEKVIYKCFNAIFNQDGFLPKSCHDQAEKLRRELVSIDYYADTPRLAPLPAYLESAEAHSLIQQIVKKLSRFKSHTGQKVTPEHTIAFVRQFGIDLIPDVLQLLTHLRVVEDKQILDLINLAASKHRNDATKTTAVVPLGGPGDSAGHYLYYLRDLESELKTKIVSGFLSPELVLRSDHIVFFDDNVNSGLQLLNIFAQWTGKSLPEDLQLKEDHASKLDDKAIVKLLSMPISIVYGLGTSGAELRVKNLLTEFIGIPAANMTVQIAQPSSEDERIFSGANSPLPVEIRARLKSAFQNKGVEIMMADGRIKERAERRALGDDNHEMMIVFPYNVPTMTLTALWCESESLPWMPLVERRRHRDAAGRVFGEDA